MINIILGIFYLQKKSLLFIFLFFLFSNLYSQNFSDEKVEENNFISQKDTIQIEREKGSIYISSGAIFYSENNLHNVKIVKLSETKNKTVYTKPISKKVSKKIFKEKNYTVKNVPFTKINFRQKNDTNFKFLSSIKSEVIGPQNYTQNFIFKNNEKALILNNYNLEKPKTSYNSTFSYFSFLSYICVRPPPVLV